MQIGEFCLLCVFRTLVAISVGFVVDTTLARTKYPKLFSLEQIKRNSALMAITLGYNSCD